jgi:formylglycine-generating enzyme required for sulfatase activity
MECLDPRDAHELAGYVGNTARLCSEAEWEYAARSCGRENRYPWGNDSADLCSRMYMPGCASLPTPGAGDTAQGLAYMADGLAEWVADCWHESLCDGPRDGSAWVTDCEPVWDSPAQEVGVLRGFGDGMVWGREAYGFSPHRREYGLSGIGFRFCADEETR